jgi:hypothetical protein
MRAIASTYLVAAKIGRPLRVEWYRTDDLNSRFDALFELTQPGIEVREHRGRSTSERLARRAREIFRRSIGWKVVVLRLERDFVYFWDLVEGKASAPKKLHLRTCHQLMSEPGMYLLFRPAPPVESAVRSYAEDLRSAVGVHIRRTDNKRAIESGALCKFMAAMDAECERNDQTRFFLASDDPLAVRELSGRYGNRLVWRPKSSYNRGDPQGIFDAAVDLWCLSRCRKLIGSYWSSFSRTAWEIRGIDHVIVGES